MATMLPTYLSDDVKSAAERRVFERLRDDPDTKDWIVLHSLGLSRHAFKRYGELDFVVLIPNGAVVCLEVKGGRIACKNGVWETTDRYDNAQRLKESPFDQARGGMFALRGIIADKADDGARLSRLAFGYGVLFPDTDWNFDGPDTESWQIYDRAFAHPISRFIKGIVAKNADAVAGFPKPTATDVAKLRQFLRPDFEAPIHPLGQIEAAENEMLRLTEDQYTTLDQLAGNARVLVEGAAGTGKTLIALEAARRAAAADLRVLAVCYNKLLGHWIAQSVAATPSAERIVAGSYHRTLEREWIDDSSQSDAYKAARTAALGSNQGTQFFREDYAFYALDAFAEKAGAPFDVLIVDEAQDLIDDAALTVFHNLLRGGLEGGRWMMFADFNRQAIFSDGRTSQQMHDELKQRAAHFASFALQRNCRNTRRIGRETALISGFDQLPFALHAQDGASVDYRFFDSAKKQRKVLGEAVKKLCDEGIAPADIVLLSHRRLESTCLTEPIEALREMGLTIAPISETNSRQTPPHTLIFSTLQAFKGLERRAVILLGVDYLDDERFRSSLYVAMSRARTRLIVLLDESARPAYNALVQRRLQWDSKA